MSALRSAYCPKLNIIFKQTELLTESTKYFQLNISYTFLILIIRGHNKCQTIFFVLYQTVTTPRLLLPW